MPKMHVQNTTRTKQNGSHLKLKNFAKKLSFPFGLTFWGPGRGIVFSNDITNVILKSINIGSLKNLSGMSRKKAETGCIDFGTKLKRTL